MSKKLSEPERRLMATGRVVENGKIFETALHFLVAGFISPNLELASVAANGNVTQQLQMLKDFARLAPLSDESRIQITDWIGRAHGVAAKRNTVVHSVYFISAHGAEGQLRKGRLSPLNELSLTSLEAIAEDLIDVVGRGALLLIRLKQEDCWNGHTIGEPEWGLA